MAITDTNALIIIAPITHFLSFYIFKERPVPRKRTAFRIAWFLAPKLAQEAQQHTGSHGRAYHTGHVRPHGMHQQVILGIVFQS